MGDPTPEKQDQWALKWGSNEESGGKGDSRALFGCSMNICILWSRGCLVWGLWDIEGVVVMVADDGPAGEEDAPNGCG